MPATLIGLACLIVFALSQAARDAFFANVFQSVSFLVVAILAFGGSTTVFGAWAWLDKPKELRVLVAHRRLFLGLNATTAAAWLAYFFALKNLEPAIVNTLYTGIGPIAVLALSALGLPLARGGRTGRLERIGYFGVGASLLAVAAVATTGQSGLVGKPSGSAASAVLVATIGGALITFSHMIARRLADLGISSKALLGLRFLFTLGLALAAELALGRAEMRPDLDAVPFLALAAFALIVIPSFFLQLGIARTSPLAVNVIRSLGPIFVFAVQQLDGRIRFSAGTLACILAFIGFALLTSVLRGWAEAGRK
ncbi:MAG: hypothetical protein QF893_18145 [Alphaproteobacteria bacterium]|jgi:drug/metabolite transporter (DMT)-like permease|nr:hypothetical protein [Alphaproteobacteria bacterium]